jgi:hypothetical protein
MKLSAKFARQEREEARVARIARRRVPREREDAIRRMLKLSQPEPKASEPTPQALVCPDCQRSFARPMHFERHRKSKHGTPEVS